MTIADRGGGRIRHAARRGQAAMAANAQTRPFAATLALPGSGRSFRTRSAV